MKTLNKRLSKKGFSLVELLVVMAVMGILTSISLMSISGTQNSQQITATALQIREALNEARTYAMANKAYTWVGFFEEDGSSSSANPAVAGSGRIVISIVASADGTRYSDAQITVQFPPPFGLSNQSNLTPLVQISPLIKLSGARMSQLNGIGNPRPTVLSNYQVGDPAGSTPNNNGGAFALRFTNYAYVTNPTTFTFPLSSSSPQYVFTKIIEFNPLGEASKIGENTYSGPGPETMEIALQMTHGSTTDGKCLNTPSAVIQLEGFSGKTRMY